MADPDTVELVPVDHDPFAQPQVSPYAAQGQTSIRNMPADYSTQLAPLDEMAFRQWVKDNRVPFDPGARTSDYDMRGFYQALQQGDPRAFTAVNPNDNQMHFTDVWKTPTHHSFSAGSQYAVPGAPEWSEDKLVSPGGRVLVDERAEAARRQQYPLPFEPER